MKYRTCIVIERLRFHAFHGVLPQERLTGNDYEVSLRIDVDVSAAVLSDRVEDTLDYAAVYRIVSEEMRKPSNLVEHVAGRVGQRLFETFPEIERIDMEILKLNPPMGVDCKGAGVSVRFVNDVISEE
ncbi:MAG: dihydroneopterin aldolase [Prevotella sp.]|nr:dihydroneopterin aldolase [Prevotella sp.]